MMSYKNYVAGLEKRRACLRTKLEEANQIRLGHLPLYNIDKELDNQFAVMPKAEYVTHSKQQRGFIHFRTQQLSALNNSVELTEITDWEQQRAQIVRRALTEYNVQRFWMDRTSDYTGLGQHRPNPSIVLTDVNRIL